MAILNFSDRVFARERLTVTSGGVSTCTAATYLQAGSPVGGNQNGTYKRAAVGALVWLDSGSGSIHFTTDGTDPTAVLTGAGVGAPASALDMIPLETLDAVKKFKAIALSANAYLEVWYLR